MLCQKTLHLLMPPPISGLTVSDWDNCPFETHFPFLLPNDQEETLRSESFSTNKMLTIPLLTFPILRVWSWVTLRLSMLTPSEQHCPGSWLPAPWVASCPSRRRKTFVVPGYRSIRVTLKWPSASSSLLMPTVSELLRYIPDPVFNIKSAFLTRMHYFN